MIISKEHKFIYFKSCKTAGTSIEVFLSAYCGKQDIITRIGEPTADWHNAQHCGIFRNHFTAGEIKGIIGDKQFNSYYKFTSIRNPLDKMLSLYYWWVSKKTISANRDFNQWVRSCSFSQWRPIFHYPFYKIGGEIVTDRFIRYESLKDDLKGLCEHFGFEYDDKYLLHYKKRERKDIVITEETKDILRRQFKKELIDLNYTI